MAGLPSGRILPISQESRKDLRETFLKTVWTKSQVLVTSNRGMTPDNQIPGKPDLQEDDDQFEEAMGAEEAALEREFQTLLNGAGSSEVHHDGSEQLGAPPGQESPVLIVLAQEPPPTLLGWLREHGNSGKRIYLLAPPTWGHDSQARELGGSRSARILVRRSAGIPFSAIYGIPEGALLWPGPTQESGGVWCLRLDQVQSEALRLHFLRLFWYHAQDEAWSSGEAKWTFRAPKERPFDVPLTSDASPLRLLEPYRHDPCVLKGEALFSPSGALPESAPSRVYVPPSGDRHTELAALTGKGSTVGWNSLQLPRAAWGASTGMLAPATSEWVLEVDLTSKQRQGLLERIPNEPEWRFKTDIRLREVASNPVWLPNESHARSATPFQAISLSDLQCDSIRRTLDNQPSSFPPPDLLAQEATYRWSNLPPVLPAGAQSDPLVAEWHRTDAQWQGSIKTLEGKLHEGESLLGKMQQSLAKWLRGNLLGFGQSKQQLAEGLEQCRQLKPSATSRKELIEATDKLKDLASRIQTFTGDLSKSQREGEESQQREQWEADRARNKQLLEDKKAKLEEAQQNEGSLAQKLAELDKTPEASRDTDWKPRRHKTNDELAKARSTLKGLESEVASLQTKLNEKFAFKPLEGASKSGAAPKGNKFVPQSPSDPAVAMPAFPSEDLPSVGQLFIHQKQRYLAITKWEELDAGEREATRLKAKLVAKE